MQRQPDTGLQNWRESPHSQWSFQNLREIVPTALIRGGEKCIPANRNNLAVTEFEPFLTNTSTDAFVVYQNGQETRRWIAPHFNPANPHIVFSISKSITAMLAGILVDQGLINTKEKVSHYLPGTRGSAYESCTVQQLLDMTVALDFTEDYLNPDGDYFRYRNATCWNPVDQTADSPCLEQFLYTLKKARFEHGSRFNYKSPNTDMAGLLLERTADTPLAQLLSDLLWRPMGAASDAYITLDSALLARAAGGICVTVDDLARFGQLVLDTRFNAADSSSILPKEWVQDTVDGGDREAWLQGDYKSLLPDGCYRNYWYQTGNSDRCFCAIGIHGQWLYINPRTRSVIVKLSSQSIPLDEAKDRLCLEEFEQISQLTP